MENIVKESKKLVDNGFDIQEHIRKKIIEQDEWCRMRLEELGEEKYEDESDFFGGSM